MGNLTNTEVIDFTAGMNTVRAPHLLAKSEALALINVDIRRGSLRSMPNLKDKEAVTGSHFIEFLNTVYAYDGFRSNALLNNNLYWANGVTSGKVLWDGRELPLGIPTPKASPTLALVNAGVGHHSGEFLYAYTFYSSSTGAESAPSPLPLSLIVTQSDIKLSALEALPIEADTYRIYRIGGYLARFTMVAAITPAELPYTDELYDTEIDGRIMSTLRSGAPLNGMHDFVELNGRLFGSLDTKLFFSALGNPDSWYSSDFFVLPQKITGIAKVPAGLLVFGVSFTYLLAGSDPRNFRLKVVSNILGCVARESIAYINEDAIWLGETGVCVSNGYSILETTVDKIEYIKNLQPSSACVLNAVYYLSFVPSLLPSELLFPADTLYPAASEGTSLLEQGIIAIDFKRGNKFSYKMISYENLTSVGVVDGEVNAIVGVSSTVYLACSQPLGCDSFLQCSPYRLNLMNLYQGQHVTTLSYVSPQFIDGSFSTLKEYDKVRINYYGKFSFSIVFSSGEIISTTELNSLDDAEILSLGTGRGVEFTKDNIVTIGIPNNNNKSYSIGFIVEGKGDIKSIQYSWKPRELP